MAMSATTKFLFETRFDLSEGEVIIPFIEEDKYLEVEEPEPEPEIVVPTFSEEELAAAKSEAYATGKAEGLRESTGTIEAQALVAMEKIVGQLAEIIKIEEAGLETATQEAVHVAVAITRKMFPRLNESHAMGEVERVVSLALEKLGGEQAVVIQVSDELQPMIENRLASLAANAGFNGRVTILGSTEIAIGDCKIQWDKGGASRDSNALKITCESASES